MGETYRITHNGKMVRRGKYHWQSYKGRKGPFFLQVWTGKGKGWETIAKSAKK